MLLALLLLGLAAAVPLNIALEPDPPVAGGTVKIILQAKDAGQVVHLSDPFGSWQAKQEVSGGDLVFDLPDGIPALLVGVGEGEEFEYACQVWPVAAADGRLMPRALFWKAYLLAGLPAPWAPAQRDEAVAAEAAQAAVNSDPADHVARELLWLLQARVTEDRDGFLRRIEAEAAGSASGRLLLAAARVRQKLGDQAGAADFAVRHKKLISEAQQAEIGRWSDVVSTSDARTRAKKILAWLNEDPLSDFSPRCLQILAATYAELGDHRATALYGLLSLRIMPNDAMTLNGVAFAMAEGGFELDRALLLSDRAVGILRKPEMLTRPTQLSERRWREELRHALAASLDTKGWVLTRLGRWQDARSAFEEAIGLERNDEYYLHFGLMLARSGKTEEAKRTLRKGARLGGRFRMQIESELARLER